MRLGHRVGIAAFLLAGLVASLGSTVSESAAQPADVEALVGEAVAARLSGDPAAAVAILVPLVEADPENTDLLIQLGFSQLALGESEAAEAAFARALELAPDYVDANFGLAEIAFRRGELDRAETEAQIVLAARDDPEATALLERIAAARAAAAAPQPTAPVRAAAPARTAVQVRPDAPPMPRWRIDVDGMYSWLTDGFQNWIEGTFQLSRIVTPDTTVTGKVELSHRFGLFDAYLEGRVDHRLSDALAFHAYLGGTPDADFRPRFVYGGEVTARIWGGHDGVGPGLATLHLSDSFNVDDRILTLTPGWQQYFLDGRAWITVKWINSFVGLSAHDAGYSIRGDLQLSDRLRVHAGYSDAPDTSDGVTVEVRSVFAGVHYAANELTTMRATFSHENRSAGYDRSVLSIGLGQRF